MTRFTISNLILLIVQDELREERNGKESSAQLNDKSKEVQQTVEELLQKEKSIWEIEKQTILKNWREENEILTYISKESKETWKKEKESLIQNLEEKLNNIQENESKSLENYYLIFLKKRSRYLRHRERNMNQPLMH